MKDRSDLIKHLSEPILRAIDVGAITINWNADSLSKETWVEYGYPNKVFISQAIPDELIPSHIRHEIRHVVFRHNALTCNGDPKRQCVVTAKEIEANGFLTQEQEAATRALGIHPVSSWSPHVQEQFASTHIPLEHIADFPPEELHLAICNDEELESNEEEDNYCATATCPQNEADSGEARAGAFLLAQTLVNNGYEDSDIFSKIGLSGGKGKGDALWEQYVKTRPLWVEKILDVLSPEFLFVRRRYIAKPLWGPLLLSSRWMASLRSRYAYRPKRAVLIVDTSGSMWGEYVFETIKPGIAALVERGLSVRLICGDTEITWDAEISTHQDIQLRGGGGTHYEDLLERAVTYQPEEIVFVTDLAPDKWPKEGPDVPVHFIVPEAVNFTPPWGTVLCQVAEGEE